MANEARVFAEGVGNVDSPVTVRQFTVADATAIAKGTFMIATAGSRTALAHPDNSNGLSSRCLGVATSSKTASDGVTEMGLQRTGVVVATASAQIRSGDLVTLGGKSNCITPISLYYASQPAELSYQLLQSFIGRAIDDIAAGSRGKIALMLG
jgi:hypothetical protein